MIYYNQDKEREFKRTQRKIKMATYGLKKWQAVEAKMRQAGQYGRASLLGEAKEVQFNEVMHKEGAYYGIEVIADGSNYGTYYISEKIWG